MVTLIVATTSATTTKWSIAGFPDGSARAMNNAWGCG